RRFRVSLQPGPANGNTYGPRVFAISTLGGMQQPPLPARTAGPAWFRKMDRNRDGDVSRREFLGSDEEFKKIDTDGDGLISAAGADAYDRLKRKEKEAKREAADRR